MITVTTPVVVAEVLGALLIARVAMLEWAESPETRSLDRRTADAGIEGAYSADVETRHVNREELVESWWLMPHIARCASPTCHLGGRPNGRCVSAKTHRSMRVAGSR